MPGKNSSRCCMMEGVLYFQDLRFIVRAKCKLRMPCYVCLPPKASCRNGHFSRIELSGEKVEDVGPHIIAMLESPSEDAMSEPQRHGPLAVGSSHHPRRRKDVEEMFNSHELKVVRNLVGQLKNAGIVIVSSRICKLDSRVEWMILIETYWNHKPTHSANAETLWDNLGLQKGPAQCTV